MAKFYGYTCTTSVKYNREDKEARKNTKQYQLLVSKCREQHIELEEVYSDFELMNSKCSEIEKLKNDNDVMFEEIIELSE